MRRLNRYDSWSVLALLVGVFLVIVVPPLPLKVLLLVGVCVGFFLFCIYSHWTHGWSRLRQRSAASVVIVLLLAFGIPQFISQWKAEHPKPVASQSPQVTTATITPVSPPVTQQTQVTRPPTAKL